MLKRAATIMVALLLTTSAHAQKVLMKTSLGEVTIELDPAKAPATVKNFLSYVDEKYYDNTTFHRVMENFMVQGGGFKLDDGVYMQKKTKDAVKNESKDGLKNVRGTIAMARQPNPDSATSQFFINVVDNPNLNYPNNGGGYTVFGKVTAGMEVIDQIRKVKTGSKYLNSLGPNGRYNTGKNQNVPLEPVMIKSITRVK